MKKNYLKKPPKKDRQINLRVTEKEYTFINRVSKRHAGGNRTALVMQSVIDFNDQKKTKKT